MAKEIKVEKLLTELELEIMQVVWEMSPCTVRDIVDKLASHRPLAYTSIATMMKILESKKVLKSEKKDSVHLYSPLIQRKEYENKALKHLTEKIFKANPSSIVMRLLDESKISKEELSEIKRMLNERLKT